MSAKAKPLGRIAIAVHGSRTTENGRIRRLKVELEDGSVAEVSHEDVLAGAIARASVESGNLPDFILCKDCGKPRAVKNKKRPRPLFCLGCCRKKSLEKNRRRTQSNPDRERERSRKWRRENPDKARAASLKWRRENIEIARESDRTFQRRKRERERERERETNSRGTL